jgi:hypothetical protein
LSGSMLVLAWLHVFVDIALRSMRKSINNWKYTCATVNVGVRAWMCCLVCTDVMFPVVVINWSHDVFSFWTSVFFFQSNCIPWILRKTPSSYLERNSAFLPRQLTIQLHMPQMVTWPHHFLTMWYVLLVEFVT